VIDLAEVNILSGIDEIALQLTEANESADDLSTKLSDRTMSTLHSFGKHMHSANRNWIE